MSFFCLGKIIKTRGLHGCLKVVSYVQKNSVLAELEYIYIENLLGKKNKYKIKKTDISGKFLFIELDGIADRKTAIPLIGSKVFLPKLFFPQLPEGEYYYDDIIGLDVITEEGEFLGQIKSIFPTGSNDVYMCRGGKREILLPSTTQVIRGIDIKKGFIKVRMLKGL